MIWRWEKVDALEVEPVLKLQKKINEIENTI
jgi:hypothetical protein